VLNSFSNYTESNAEISKESILAAEKISKYFIAMGKKIKVESQDRYDIKSVAKKDVSTFDKIKMMYEQDPEFNRTDLANALNISRQALNKHLKKIK